jgi:glutathione S-transferase
MLLSMTKTNQLTLLEFDPTGLSSHESYSPFCMKVHRALRVAGLSYQTRATFPAAAKKYNTKGQLPVLMVDDEPVADSTNILNRIELLTGASLSGPNGEVAAEARLWEEMADGALYGYVVASRWADDANWQRTRAAYFGGLPPVVRSIVPNRLRARVVATLVARDIWRGGSHECWSRLSALLDDFERRAPETGFFLGDTLTRADIALFAQLHSFRTDLTPVQRDQVAKRKRLSAWLDRVDAVTRS